MNDLAVNTLAGRAPPGIGHNAAPLAEQLVEELAEARVFDDELIAAATESRIAGLYDAEKCTLLVAKIRAQERTLAAAHKARKEPYLRDGRLVDKAYHPEIERLLATRTALERMLTAWEYQRREKARIERERLAAEQRQREAEADHARAVAEAAKAAGNGSIAQELAALRAQEEADRLGRAADAVRPDAIRTAVGSVSMRREKLVKVVDVRKALGWVLKQPGGASAAEQFLRTWLGAFLRGVSLDIIEAKGLEIPGVEVTIEQKASVR